MTVFFVINLEEFKKILRLKIFKKLRIASLNSEFTRSYKNESVIV